MLNNDIIQNNLSSLRSVSVEAEKLKKKSEKNQEANQNKFDEIVSKQIISVNATDQDSDPQKILDEEEKEKQQKFSKHKNTVHSKRDIMKDTNKGTVIDIKC